ncbi:copper chaperone PCu(A)C [Vibrio sp. LaRot3]|uniref:copper chaperone PCu(A)C n=1 Tax=Vibrio sp. LaRot3 TaxID=2998829 RepID=UPI0022CDCF1E|nr:copper chaperone PCu(A)C [Vibrio sp. LaRot3]MDA0149060.1 copper chaperone PCu(A)C [Vibrio sp. LaRot3]
MKLNTFLLLSTLIAPLAHASADIMTHHPYARATPPNAATSAVFVELMNHSDTDRAIISASTSVAGKVELHDVIHEGDVMKMRQVDQIKVPAQETVSLKPGSLHIMLFELNKPLIEGEAIEVEISFANGEKQTFTAPIKKVMSGMKHHH